jgi:ornithine carbamoyltransferase
MKNKHFLTLKDFTKDEIIELLEISKNFKQLKKDKKTHKYCEGKNIVLLFQKDSTRTRCGFEVASFDLGINTTYIGPTGSQMGKKESIKDTARVLGRYYDGIEFRGYSHKDVEILAEYSGVPVWNGLTDSFHPTQILADLLTIEESFGKIEEIKIVYIGDARNNVANSLIIGAAKLEMHLTIVAPRKLWPEKEIVEYAREQLLHSKGSLHLTEDVLDGTKEQQVIYTDTWVSMGEPENAWEERISLLEKYQVNEKIMNNTNTNSIFLHCLPSFHNDDTKISKDIIKKFGKKYPKVANGEMEVTDKVLEGPKSKVFDQSENRLHTTKAIIYKSLKN